MGFWHRVKKVEGVDLPPAPSGAGASHRVHQCCQYKTRHKQEPLAASHPCPSSTGFCFPQPHDLFPSPMTSPGLLLRFGSFLMAHLPLQEPTARVTVLFNRMGLLPMQAQGGAGGWGCSCYTPQPQPTAPEGHSLETQTCCWLCSGVTLSLDCVSKRGKTARAVCFASSPCCFPGSPSPRSQPGEGECPQTQNHPAGGYLWSICYGNQASKCLSSLKSSASLNCHIFKAVD